MHAHLFLPQSPWGGANVTIVLIFHFLQPVVWWLQNAVRNETSAERTAKTIEIHLGSSERSHHFTRSVCGSRSSSTSLLVPWSTGPPVHWSTGQSVQHLAGRASISHQVDVSLLYLDNRESTERHNKACSTPSTPTAQIQRIYSSVSGKLSPVWCSERTFVWLNEYSTEVPQWSHRWWAGWWKYSEQTLRIMASNKIRICSFSLSTFCSFTHCAPWAKCCQGSLDWEQQTFLQPWSPRWTRSRTGKRKTVHIGGELALYTVVFSVSAPHGEKIPRNPLALTN